MAVALPNAAKVVKWASDMDKFVLSSNFDKRGWVRGSVESELRCYPCLQRSGGCCKLATYVFVYHLLNHNPNL